MKRINFTRNKYSIILTLIHVHQVQILVGKNGVNKAIRLVNVRWGVLRVSSFIKAALPHEVDPTYPVVHQIVLHFVGSSSSGGSIGLVTGVGQMHAGGDSRSQIVPVVGLPGGADVAQGGIRVMQHGSVMRRRRWWWWLQCSIGATAILTMLARSAGCSVRGTRLIGVAWIVVRIRWHIGYPAHHARNGTEVGGKVLKTLHRNAAIQTRHAALQVEKCGEKTLINTALVA